MEQLVSLAWGDWQSDTTVFPTASTGGVGLTIGGSSDPTAPVTGYVDYLDISGQPSSSAANWFYIRVWQISSVPSFPYLKQVTVTAKTRTQVGAPQGALPQSTLVSLKTSPF